MAKCWSFLASTLSSGSVRPSGKQMMGLLHPGEVSRRRTPSVGCWTLGLVICSKEISYLNSSEFAWFFVDLGTHLKLHREILDFNLRMNCTYSAIRKSLVTYSSVIDY